MEFGFETITAPERAGSMRVGHSDSAQAGAWVIHEVIIQESFRIF